MLAAIVAALFAAPFSLSLSPFFFLSLPLSLILGLLA